MIVEEPHPEPLQVKDREGRVWTLAGPLWRWTSPRGVEFTMWWSGLVEFLGPISRVDRS